MIAFRFAKLQNFKFFILNFKLSETSMPTFNYTAVNDKGSIMSGETDAQNRNAALSYLNHLDLTVVSIKEQGQTMGKFSSLNYSAPSAIDKLMLTKHLSIIIKAGLSLKEGLDTLLNDARKKVLIKLLAEAKSNLEKGQPLSYTFKKYPNYFSKVFIALLEAGEMSGTLEKSLDYLGLQIEKDYKMNQKVRNAMIYPAILIFASIAVITILMVLVIPRLTKVFFQNNLNLPWSTKFIMSVSEFLGSNIVAIMITLVGTVIIFSLVKNQRSFQFFSSSVMFRIPVVSDLYKKIILARFTRTLGILLSNGVSILKAIDISSEVLGYNRYRDDFKKINTEISQGSSLGLSLRRRKERFPYLIINMVTVGEKTGKLDSVLGDLASFYEEEVDNGLKNIISLIEPLLILVMGLVVGGIAFSIIVPIYQIVGTVG